MQAPEGAFPRKALHAVKNEMAIRLSDVMLRRTSDVERGRLTQDKLDWTMAMMRRHFLWSSERAEQEMENFQAALLRAHARVAA